MTAKMTFNDGAQHLDQISCDFQQITTHVLNIAAQVLNYIHELNQ